MDRIRIFHIFAVLMGMMVVLGLFSAYLGMELGLEKICPKIVLGYSIFTLFCTTLCFSLLCYNSSRRWCHRGPTEVSYHNVPEFAPETTVYVSLRCASFLINILTCVTLGIAEYISETEGFKTVCPQMVLSIFVLLLLFALTILILMFEETLKRCFSRCLHSIRSRNAAEPVPRRQPIPIITLSFDNFRNEDVSGRSTPLSPPVAQVQTEPTMPESNSFLNVINRGNYPHPGRLQGEYRRL